jgi:hypothetical protein
MTELPAAVLRLIARVEVELGTPLEVGAVALGTRRVIPIVGGRVQGEELSGEILSGGADWQIVAPDGTAVIDTRYALRTAQGSTVTLATRGFRHGPPEVLARLAAGEEVDPRAYTFRVAVTLESGDPALGWVNRTVFVAVAARHAAQVVYDLYALD